MNSIVSRVTELNDWPIYNMISCCVPQRLLSEKTKTTVTTKRHLAIDIKEQSFYFYAPKKKKKKKFLDYHCFF